MTQQDAQAVVRSVRPAMKDLTEQERAQFLYDLTRAVYDGVKLMLRLRRSGLLCQPGTVQRLCE